MEGSFLFLFSRVGELKKKWFSSFCLRRYVAATSLVVGIADGGVGGGISLLGWYLRRVEPVIPSDVAVPCAEYMTYLVGE